jgi:glycosyltransferase involved in cell wall biosynthesis
VRITFVLPDANLSGGTRVIAMYAEHLQRRGHQVLVVSTKKKVPRPLDRLKLFIKGYGWWSSNPGPSYFDTLNVDHRVINRFRPITDSDLPDADVVVATWWETAEWVAQLSPRKGAKAQLIQQMESNFPYQPVDRVEATWRLPLQKIVVSHWLADIARDQFGDSTSVIVPNGIDLNLFHAPPRGKQSRPTVGMLYSPRSPHKGNASAIAAVELATRCLPDLLLRAFGTGPLIASMPLPQDAQYTRTPPQRTLCEIYARCDVWLCASTSEGYHLPPHEAMACRCPVVSTRVGGPMDLIEEGVNGYLVDVGDTEGLASRLIDVLCLSESSWQQMSEAAYKTAEKFTWEDASALLEKALDLAIKRFGTTSPEPLVPGEADTRAT